MVFTGAASMKKAVVIFFVSCFMGAGMALIGGLCLDTWYNAMIDIGWFDVPAEWDSSAALAFLMRLFYFGCMLLPIFGIVVLVLTIYNRYILDHGEDEEDNITQTYTGGNI